MSIKRRGRVLSKTIAQIQAVKTKVKNTRERIFTEEQILSDGEYLHVTYKGVESRRRKYLREITEIVSVAYITVIKGKEYTVLYYDSHHDKRLHLHVYESIKNKANTIHIVPFTMNRNLKKLLKWVLNNIRQNWIFYRRKYYKRSGIKTEI